MSRLGPVITLAAGAVLAAGLGVASITATPAANTTAAADNNPAAEAPAAEENTAQPSPSPAKSEAKRIEKADYGGRVKGNGALIAISIRDGKAIGYFCDGRTEAWFKGSQTADGVSLKGVAGGNVNAELGGGRAKGWVSLGGKKWSFVAPTVVKPSGLYRATALVRGAQFKAGWIRVKNPNGGYTTVGAATEGGSRVPVPELNDQQPTAPLTVGDTTVYPQDVDGFIEEMQ
ncbi:hypothetical protein ETD86_50770 [Nonomuraea turkmeniaca]|uniref:Serine/threonine protein kinase n=1 Tax=Nonomuraea turkmeniaca TaxID=103838 RepID=A0A5S4EVV4_9ACTN|nr:hypothetical protein [Nonomuraea turkmeniaca]TMR07726.1 hypothetical protein ETD86_50770 [Nonomuraea turkmeniaca]